MKTYKRENKTVVKKELKIFIEDEIDDEIEMMDDIFSFDDYEDFNFPEDLY